MPFSGEKRKKKKFLQIIQEDHFSKIQKLKELFEISIFAKNILAKE